MLRHLTANKIVDHYAVKILLWLFFILSFLFLFFYDLPHKGFDFTDHGLYLFESMLTTKGIVPWNGFAPFINGMFMKFGIHNYLFFERLYYLISLIAVVAFWKSLRQTTALMFLPFALIISLVHNNTYMICYQTLPVFVAMFGLAALFQAKECRRDLFRVVYYFLAAILISFFAFSNIALCLTSLTSLVLVGCFLRHSPYRYVFHITYIIFCTLFACIYFLSPDSLLAIGMGGQLTCMQILAKVPLMFAYFLSKLLIVFGLLGLFLLLWVIIFFIHIRKHLFSGVGFFLQSIKFLQKNRATIFVFLTLAFLLSSRLVWNIYHNLHNNIYSSNLVQFGMLQLSIFLIALLVFYKKHELYAKIVFAFFLLLPAIVAIATSTASPFDTHIALFTPFFITATCILFAHNLSLQERWYVVTKIIFITIFLALTILGLCLQGSYTYRSFPIAENKMLIQNGVLSGIYVNEEKYRNINSILQHYQNYDCKDKYFIAYPTLPLLYYIFNREPMFYQAWITARWGAVRENASPFLQALTQHEKWCVFEAPGFDCEGNANYLLPLRLFLQKNSVKVISFEPHKVPDHFDLYPYNYTLYVK